MNEKHLTSKIIKYLNSLSQTKAVKFVGNESSETGTPDVVACIEGKAFPFEVKMEGNKPTKIQLYRIDQWKKAGAVVAVVYSLDEVRAIVTQNKG